MSSSVTWKTTERKSERKGREKEKIKYKQKFFVVLTLALFTSSAALLQANSCTPAGTTQISCSKPSMFICSSCVCAQTRVTPPMLVLALSLELHCHLWRVLDRSLYTCPLPCPLDLLDCGGVWVFMEKEVIMSSLQKLNGYTGLSLKQNSYRHLLKLCHLFWAAVCW